MGAFVWIGTDHGLVLKWQDTVIIPTENEYGRGYGLSNEMAKKLCASRTVCDFYENVLIGFYPSSFDIHVARWVGDTLIRELRYRNMSFEEIDDDGFRTEFRDLMREIYCHNLTEKNGVDLLRILLDHRKRGDETKLLVHLIRELEDGSDLSNVVAEVITANAEAVQDLKSGKGKALNFLIGCVMKQTRGRFDPQKVRLILVEALK